MADARITSNRMSINGQGRVPSWSTTQEKEGEECDSVGMNELAEEVFQQHLIDIDEEMGIEDLHALKFLCVDYIPVSKLESAASSLDIFAHMKKSLLIDCNNVDFLLECLGRVHRFDLVRKIGYEPDLIKAELPNMEKVTPYRRFLMELAEDMDDKDLQKLKFYLSGQIKKKKLSDASTILDVFVLIEQEGIVSPDKPEAMVDIMRSIGRTDLVRVINEFTGNAPVRAEPVFTRVTNPVAGNQQPVEQQPALPVLGIRTQDQRFLSGNAPQQREALVGSGMTAGGRPIVGRSPSAGTLSVSESESGSLSEAAGGEYIPPDLFHQIADGLKHQFIDTGIELGFTNDEIDMYNLEYQNLLEKTKKLLNDWQARKLDKRQIAPGLHHTLIKLGEKNLAGTLKNWMESCYHGNQPTQQDQYQALRGASGRVPVGAPNRQLVPQGQEINYTASINEARPQQFGFPDNRPGEPVLPTPVGPPINNYQQQEQENVCISVREARPHIINPQIQDINIERIEQRIRSMNLSGQTQPQQVVNNVIRQTATLDPQIPVPEIRPTNQVADGNDTGLRLPEYNMTKRPRGWCVIINNREFNVASGDSEAKEMPPRIGTDKDAESLQHVFEKLGFTIHRRDNLKDTEIMRTLNDVSYNVDHSNFDCLVVCVLTHGVENHVYGSNGRLVSIKDITSTFQANRCPKLGGKPKLFFFQACQGRNKMEGNDIERDAVVVRSNGRTDGGGQGNQGILDSDDDNKEMIPNEADFLIGYATVPGYVSFRSRNHGSWYIRKLCELLEKHSSRHDLLSILVEVNREVSHANAHIDGGIFKQTPAPLVTLRKKLYFR